MSKIFISYRREDSAYIAEAIYDALALHFGEDNVFKDVNSIKAGVDFRKSIDAAVKNCDVALAVISTDWLGILNERGKRSIKQSTDYVRLELEACLTREIPVIPICVRGAQVPAEHELPKSIAALAYRNAITVRPGNDFDSDLEALCHEIEDGVYVGDFNEPKSMIHRFSGATGRARLENSLLASSIISSSDIAHAVAATAELQLFGEGRLITQQGSSDSDFYLILSGRVQIKIGEIVLSRLGSGQCIGEMSAVNPSIPRSATAIALEPTIVAKLRVDELTEIGSKHPDIWHCIARVLADRMYDVYRLLEDWPGKSCP